jgi:hypothetical protein
MDATQTSVNVPRVPGLENSRTLDPSDLFPALSFRREARNLLFDFCIVLCGCGEAERKAPENARTTMPLQGIPSMICQQRQRRRRG